MLLVNPGGPGAPAGDLVRLLVGAFPEVPATLGPEVLARYDVVGLDPRGTGGPGTVRCLTDAQREEALDADLDPDLPCGQDRAGVLADVRELTEDCAARNDAALLSQLATDDVARDMDLLRGALGEQQVSYYGASYGTLLGATYATLFPERVRHLVLDSPVHPTSWQRPLPALTEQAASGEQVLDTYFAACVEAGPDCPFGAGRPAEAFDELVDRLEAAPLIVPAVDNTPEGRVDGATAAVAARVAMIDRGLWPLLTLGLVSAEDGERPGPDSSPGTRSCRAPRGRCAPTLCSPVPTPPPGRPPSSCWEPGWTRRPPYPWARAVTDSLDEAVLLTVDGVGHVVLRQRGECVDGAVDT